MYLTQETLFRVPDDEETKEPKKRLTYPQKWKEYNLSQINEKRRFLELLYTICQGIEDLPRKDGAGRNRIAFRDMIFAVVYKTYTGVSARRFMSDLRMAKIDGYVDKIPHFNSLYNYLELPEMKNALKALVKLSALPLKAIETDFAVDSSGFSKKSKSMWKDHKHGSRLQYEKRDWLKCHLICGVVTNIVTSVEITNGSASDHPQFARLVNATAKSFEIEEVSADKAYLSAKNLRNVERHGGTAYIPFKSNSTPNHYTNDTLWKKLYYYFKLNEREFNRHYHKRSNVESTFFMIKQKFGERLKSKTKQAQINELLCKVLCHNLCCVVKAVYELDIDLDFF